MHPALANLKVVLVGTRYGGNVGSACRAMANCGLSELRLVAPSPDLTWAFAEQMAVHATGILESRKTFATLAEAVADCAAVVGTSRRGGLYRQHSAEAREAAPGLVRTAATAPVAIVFGREDKGLLNEELLLCTHIVRIPAAPAYPSFNLAQSVVLVCHELYRATLGARPLPSPEEDASPPASSKMRQTMLAHWREMLLETGFTDGPRADHMMEGFGRIFARGAKTEADMRILMGLARQARWAAASGRELAAARGGVLESAACPPPNP